MKKIIFVLVLALLFVTGCTKEEGINYSKLEEFGKGDYNFIKSISNSDYIIFINSDGKVVVNFDKELDGVDNAKDIIFFSNDDKNNLYILSEDGYIYKYNMSDYEKDKFVAKKVSKYEKIREIVTYRTRKNNAGGCDYLIAIDGNNEYSEIDSFCH